MTAPTMGTRPTPFRIVVIRPREMCGHGPDDIPTGLGYALRRRHLFGRGAGAGIRSTGNYYVTTMDGAKGKHFRAEIEVEGVRGTEKAVSTLVYNGERVRKANMRGFRLELVEQRAGGISDQ